MNLLEQVSKGSSQKEHEENFKVEREIKVFISSQCAYDIPVIGDIHSKDQS